MGFVGNSRTHSFLKKNLQTLVMSGESIQGAANNYEQRFSTLEIEVVDISHKMSIAMATLEREFGPFGDFGGSNSNFGLEGKIEDKSDPEKEPTKEPDIELLSYGTNIPSQSLFNIEAKVDIKLYQGEIDTLKLNHWL